MNILLIEPDDFMRSLFQGMLERDGFHVTAVRDDRDGLAAAGSVPFDLVVAQFFEEADAASIADLLAAVRARSPWFRLLAVVSGFRTKAPAAAAVRRMLHPWRTVDLTWGGHVVLDACQDAARERRPGASPPVPQERSHENPCS